MQFTKIFNLKRKILPSIFACLFALCSSIKVCADANLPLHTGVPGTSVSDTKNALTPHAAEAAKLLGIENQVHRLLNLKNSGKIEAMDPEALKLQLSVVRKIMTASLELRTTAAKFDREITFETQVADKLSRERDMAVAATNNLNFLQLGILSTIIDGPLAQSHNPTNNRDSNRLNIVSGLMVGGLAALALVEEHGGVRPSAATPNMLGQSLGLDAPDSVKLPPMLWIYLNSVSPTSERGLTRREHLIEYWEHGKMLSVNVKKESTREKVSALGPHHRWWNETIKLINSRITMLFDLRAMTDMLNGGLVELLQALD